MYDIFRKASTVLAWLGLPSMEHIPLLNLLVACPDDHNPWSALENRSHGSACKLQELCDITDLFLAQTSWFGRQWIRQEVHAASDLQIFCGMYRFHFNSLVSISESLSRVRKRLTPGSLGVHNAFSAFQILHTDYRGREVPIGGHDPASQVWTDMLLESAFFDSTLPQDKIFAVSGMVQATVRADPLINRGSKSRTPVKTGLQVDYSRPLPLLYADVMKMLRELSPYMEILLCFRACHKVVIEDLPSWFPDFQKPASGVMWANYDRRRRGVYIQDYNQDNGTITVNGNALATVSSEDNLSHQASFHQALVENFPDEKVDLSALPLRLYGCQRGINGFLILPIACRRLMDECSFSLVGLRVLNEKSSDRQARFEGYNLIALVPRAAIAGDILVELEGSSACFLLRPSARRKGHYFFLGTVLVFYTKKEEPNSWRLVDLDDEDCSWLHESATRTTYCIC